MPSQDDDGKDDVDEEDKSMPMQHSKLRTLKDRMWVREALEDLTAAEFACSLASSASAKQEDSEKRKKSAVDFENILAKLEKRIEDMCVLSDGTEENTSCIATYPVDDYNGDGACWVLKKNGGMGSVTYTDDQRETLIARILSSRQNILQAMSGSTATSKTDDLDEIREKLQTSDAIPGDDEKDKNAVNPVLYVRDDGTIDWDGALQDREAVQKFGTSVWARINGREVSEVDDDSIDSDIGSHGGHGEKKVEVKIVETEEIKEKKAKLEELQIELKKMEKDHTALLNSAVSAGSAVANVNLASLDAKLRSKIRESNDDLERKKDEVSFQQLNYEMERIYTYLDTDLGNTANTGYIPLQDRLNVAEFGLLESQLLVMNSQLRNGEVVDNDVLSVMLDQTVDFKRRLGIDYYVAGLTLDKEAFKIWANDLLKQSKKGLEFYGKGVQLLANDVIFSSSLITRALTGYTLKPREVRTVRRTFKDILTFIPFVIILIIPLTPIGHVLVFGAIQRFFPDFFPSCFTETRQNLFSLYESTEYSEITIEENWQEKVIRILEATGFLIVDNAKKVFGQAEEDAKGQ